MGKPAAKEGDTVVSPADLHLVQIPSPVGPVTVPLPHPFSAKLSKDLSEDVNIMGKPAATKGSGGKNDPQHVAMGIKFVTEPSNECSIFLGSLTVKINGKSAARAGDPALTCNDPSDVPVGKVIAQGSVMIGG